MIIALDVNMSSSQRSETKLKRRAARRVNQALFLAGQKFEDVFRKNPVIFVIWFEAVKPFNFRAAYLVQVLT